MALERPFFPVKTAATFLLSNKAEGRGAFLLLQEEGCFLFLKAIFLSLKSFGLLYVSKNRKKISILINKNVLAQCSSKDV